MPGLSIVGHKAKVGENKPETSQKYARNMRESEITRPRSIESNAIMREILELQAGLFYWDFFIFRGGL